MNKRAPITCILGKRGSGKSTLLKELVKKGGYKRVIVVDTLGEHGEGRRIVRTPTGLIGAVKTKAFNVAVQFVKATEGFRWACDVAYAVGDLALVVEEADFYITAWRAPECFEKLVRYGRHRGVEMICVSRRPPDLWRNLTANADYLCVFRTTEPRDIRYLQEFMGEAALRLKVIKEFEYLRWHNGEVSHEKTAHRYPIKNARH